MTTSGHILTITCLSTACLLAGDGTWSLPKGPPLPHPRLIENAQQLREQRALPEVVRAARALADPYLKLSQTSAWPGYFSPLPSSVMPARHFGNPWPY